MKEPTFLGRPFGLLGIVVLMGVLIFVGGEHFRSQAKDPHQHALPAPSGPLERIRSESHVFHPADSAVPLQHEAETDVKIRDLADYYALRHYPGAPPRIPHEVDPEMAKGPDCNICHEKGGFVAKFNAYTPVTPHPDFANCLQCHVTQSADEPFRGTGFVAVAPPELHRPLLPGGPPPIPHSLQLRESCLSCHAGPAAPLSIRTTHPERVNCRQCHVPSDPGKAFQSRLMSMSGGAAE